MPTNILYMTGLTALLCVVVAIWRRQTHVIAILFLYVGNGKYKGENNFIKPRDWVIDIGANVGHYTKRFSDLVGPEGVVIAFEPVSETFSLLAANVQLFKFANVTLINAAASDELSLVGMKIPSFNTGLKNFYQAHVEIVISESNFIKVITLKLDLFQFPYRIS